MLLSDGWDIWKVPVHGGAGVNLTVNGKKDKIRYRSRYRLDPDEKGIDLDAAACTSTPTASGPRKSGIALIEPGKPRAACSRWDDASYGTLMKAKHADVYLYTRETVNEFPELLRGGKCDVAMRRRSPTPIRSRRISCGRRARV